MQNEILKPVLDTDEVAVPRYDIVGPNGSVIQQNVELRLKNEVVQEGTPYDEESVLPASLREQLELPQSATPAEAFLRMLKVSGGAVARNRAPQTSDAQPAGKIWIVPKMVFNNQMPNALTQVASNWKCTAATAAVSGNKVTVTGNGSAATLVAEATMLTAASTNDLLYVTADITVLDDANSVTIELVCGDNVVATQNLDVPTAGDTMQLVARAPAGANAVPTLRVTSVYNTASAQAGKRVAVAAITVWNLTADMCQIEPELEFTQVEATAYLTQYGAFQTREYEYSMWWWLCHGKLGEQYIWTQGMDYYWKASRAESVLGTNAAKWVTPYGIFQALTAADSALSIPWDRVHQLRNILVSLNRGNSFGYVADTTASISGMSQTSNVTMSFTIDGWQTTNLSYFNTLTGSVSLPMFCPKITLKGVGKGTGSFAGYGSQKVKYQLSITDSAGNTITTGNVEVICEPSSGTNFEVSVDIPLEMRPEQTEFTLKLKPIELYYSRVGNSGTYTWTSFTVTVQSVVAVTPIVYT